MCSVLHKVRDAGFSPLSCIFSIELHEYYLVDSLLLVNAELNSL